MEERRKEANAAQEEVASLKEWQRQSSEVLGELSSTVATEVTELKERLRTSEKERKRLEKASKGMIPGPEAERLKRLQQEAMTSMQDLRGRLAEALRRPGDPVSQGRAMALEAHEAASRVAELIKKNETLEEELRHKDAQLVDVERRRHEASMRTPELEADLVRMEAEMMNLRAGSEREIRRSAASALSWQQFSMGMEGKLQTAQENMRQMAEQFQTTFQRTVEMQRHGEHKKDEVAMRYAECWATERAEKESLAGQINELQEANSQLSAASRTQLERNQTLEVQWRMWRAEYFELLTACKGVPRRHAPGALRSALQQENLSCTRRWLILSTLLVLAHAPPPPFLWSVLFWVPLLAAPLWISTTSSFPGRIRRSVVDPEPLEEGPHFCHHDDTFSLPLVRGAHRQMTHGPVFCPLPVVRGAHFCHDDP